MILYEARLFKVPQVGGPLPGHDCPRCGSPLADDGVRPSQNGWALILCGRCVLPLYMNAAGRLHIFGQKYFDENPKIRELVKAAQLKTYEELGQFG